MVHGMANMSQTASMTLREQWIDSTVLPGAGAGDVSAIAGNASDDVKQLTLDTLAMYGMGNSRCFGSSVGEAVRFTYINVDRRERGHGSELKQQATTIAELTVARSMLSSAGVMHSGCIAYLIDNCCGTPLVALGLSTNRNGFGVTQAMNILYHSHAPEGVDLIIRSTSMTLGSRTMSARCEVLEKYTGRLIASAYLNKMQPTRL